MGYRKSLAKQPRSRANPRNAIAMDNSKATRSSSRKRVATLKVRSSNSMMGAKIEKGLSMSDPSELSPSLQVSLQHGHDNASQPHFATEGGNIVPSANCNVIHVRGNEGSDVSHDCHEPAPTSRVQFNEQHCSPSAPKVTKRDLIERQCDDAHLKRNSGKATDTFLPRNVSFRDEQNPGRSARVTKPANVASSSQRQQQKVHEKKSAGHPKTVSSAVGASKRPLKTQPLNNKNCIPSSPRNTSEHHAPEKPVNSFAS